MTLWVIAAFRDPWKLIEGMIVWTALVFLPAINALFDVVSLQLSRFLIGKIEEDSRVPNIVWMVIDVACALLLLAGLYGTIFLSLWAVDQWLFPEIQLFPVDRWWALFWDAKDWFHPEILWLTLMASTTLLVTAIHISLTFAHLFVPLWHRNDREKIAELIQVIEAEAEANQGRPAPDVCRKLASAYYFPWEHGIVLGTLTLWAVFWWLYSFVLHG
uniref:Uncharacterized protein n=1 Tax=Candidatus Kentrum sp. MB TaxID=2138164 RepID=A0A451BAH9_9GAMM|nr:MAG: hypothetical protein BECKMB1821G_GA0114241_100725 [Candidatus Kentron sp. MB]VFK30495.1 MAG: hypothetical protein BECKMB1821I_GA0114274_10167 [Candidatus Kentron sp. MB]VFK75274.1 MAG: hypothetical protein BECKMB1821H_GA0114242_10196 [Candidatus Kentron sp. MB]